MSENCNYKEIFFSSYIFNTLNTILFGQVPPKPNQKHYLNPISLLMDRSRSVFKVRIWILISVKTWIPLDSDPWTKCCETDPFITALQFFFFWHKMFNEHLVSDKLFIYFCGSLDYNIIKNCQLFVCSNSLVVAVRHGIVGVLGTILTNVIWQKTECMVYCAPL